MAFTRTALLLPRVLITGARHILVPRSSICGRGMQNSCSPAPYSRKVSLDGVLTFPGNRCTSVTEGRHPHGVPADRERRGEGGDGGERFLRRAPALAGSVVRHGTLSPCFAVD